MIKKKPRPFESSPVIIIKKAEGSLEVLPEGNQRHKKKKRAC